jgi:threonine dehydrogenase-like Zn-dependent dehydrogenase
LGLYTCAILNDRGIRHIYCVDIQPKRLAQVSQFGGHPIDGRPVQYADSCGTIEQAHPDGVDAVLEVAGASTLVSEGIRRLRIGGFYGFIGMVHPDTALDITGEQIIRNCLTIVGIHNYSPSHLDEAIAFLERTASIYPYESLVSPPYPLANLEEALSEAKKQTYSRVAVTPI